MERILKLSLGAIIQDNESVNFRVWAPFAKELKLEIIGKEKPSKIYNMLAEEHGYFNLNIPKLSTACYYYCFDAEKKIPDPCSRFQPYGVFGPSQVISPAFDWQDQNWHGILLENYIIYELHVGTYTQQGSFEGILSHLDDLKNLGITAIEIMPIAQFSGKRNWGYDGVFPFAVQCSYGSPYQLKQLINACHKKNIAVILDVVYNHIGPEGNVFHHFGPYFSSHYKTAWGEAINYDGEYSDEVRRFFIENAIYWLEEFHFDALRLDALHAIFDISAQPFLAELSAHIKTLEKKLQRSLYLFVESNLNAPRFVTPTKKGGYGLDAHWNDDFHHVIHSLITNETNGYYQDYHNIKKLLKAYQQGFVFTGQYSQFRKCSYGKSSKKISADKLIVFSQNHDQIGNRPQGDRLTKQLNHIQLKLVASLIILSPYIPLLFMGEEFAEISPFQYFIDFDNEKLINQVRKGRKNEFQEFIDLADVMPDPKDENVFKNCILHHSLKNEGMHKSIFEYYKQLLTLRKSHPVIKNLNNKTMKVNVFANKKSLYVHRWHLDQEIIMLFNIANIQLHISFPVESDNWVLLLDNCKNTENIKAVKRVQNNKTVKSMELLPYQFMLYEKEMI